MKDDDDQELIMEWEDLALPPYTITQSLELDTEDKKEWTFVDLDNNIYVQNDQVITLTQDSEQFGKMTIYGPNEEMFVEVDLKTGNHVFGDNYTPDEAAEIFWDAMARVGMFYYSSGPQVSVEKDHTPVKDNIYQLFPNTIEVDD